MISPVTVTKIGWLQRIPKTNCVLPSARKPMPLSMFLSVRMFTQCVSPPWLVGLLELFSNDDFQNRRWTLDSFAWSVEELSPYTIIAEGMFAWGLSERRCSGLQALCQIHTSGAYLFHDLWDVQALLDVVMQYMLDTHVYHEITFTSQSNEDENTKSCNTYNDSAILATSNAPP